VRSLGPHPTKTVGGGGGGGGGGDSILPTRGMQGGGGGVSMELATQGSVNARERGSTRGSMLSRQGEMLVMSHES